jgi:YVTN family beta-propeller protein
MNPFLTVRATGLALASAALFSAPRLAWPLSPPLPASVPAVERHVIGGSGGWDFVTFDSTRRRVFITRGDRVEVWDVDAKAVVSEIAGTAGVHGVALAQELNRGFTSNGRANTVSVFGLDDLRISATIAIPGDNPDAILYVPALKRVFAFNGRSKDVTVIDAVALKVLATVALGGKPEVAVADAQGRVFVNIEDTGEIVGLDASGTRVERRWPLKPCEEPTGLAIDAVHQRLFSVCANHMMVVIDASSGRVVSELPIGAEPDGVQCDPSSGRAFSSNGQGTLTVVSEEDPEHFKVETTIVTQPRARTLTLDPASHLLYLVTASFGAAPPPTAEQPRPRAPMVKDTFTLLVVNPN